MSAIISALESGPTNINGSLDEQISLLKYWYREDTNAVPPEYVLQPITYAVKDNDNENMPQDQFAKLEAEARKVWPETESKLKKVLRTAVSQCHDNVHLRDEECRKYTWSGKLCILFQKLV